MPKVEIKDFRFIDYFIFINFFSYFCLRLNTNYTIILEKAMARHSIAWKNPMDEGTWKAAVHGVAEG